MAGKENTLQEFGKYVSQSVLSQLGVSCYILADTYFIERCRGRWPDGAESGNTGIQRDERLWLYVGHRKRNKIWHYEGHGK